MSFPMKICASCLLIGLQILFIAVVCWVSPATLVKWGFMRYRNENAFPWLKECGEQLRRNPEDGRYLVITNVVLGSLALDVPVLFMWLN